MFGLAGGLDLPRPFPRLLARFHAARVEVVGVAHRQAELCYVKLGASQNELRVDFVGTEPCGAVEISDIVEQIHTYLSKRGWADCPIAVGLSGDDALLYALDLPQEMAEEEGAAAARWEMDAWLMEHGYDAEAFAIQPRMDSVGGAWSAAAVQKAALAAWAKACEETGLSLVSISALAPQGKGISAAANGLCVGEDVLSFASAADVEPARQMGTALAAALASVGAGRSLGIRVWGGEMARSPWHVRRISGLAACLTLAILLSVFAIDGWQYYEAVQGAKEQEAQLGAVSHDRKAMRLIQEKQESVRRRDALLEELSAQSFPWYSVLVHLGTPALCVEGVWLDGMALRGGSVLELQGNAVSYDALSTFLTAFETDTDFFPNGAVLEESGAADGDRAGRHTDGMIHFRLAVKL